MTALLLNFSTWMDSGVSEKLISPLTTEICTSGSHLWAWRGGILHELSKGKASVRVCASFRGVFLTDVVAKCYRGLLRQRSISFLAQYAPRFHIRSHLGSSFAAQGTRSASP